MDAPTFTLDQVMDLYNFGLYSSFDEEDGSFGGHRCNCCGWVFGTVEPAHAEMIVRSIDGSQNCPVGEMGLDDLYSPWANGDFMD